MDDEEIRDEFDSDMPKKNIPDPLIEDDIDGIEDGDETKETETEEEEDYDEEE